MDVDQPILDLFLGRHTGSQIHPQLFSSGAEVKDSKQGKLRVCVVISAIYIISARHMRTW